MLHPELTSLVVAVRVYPGLKDEEQDFDKPPRKWNRPNAIFVVDTETRTGRTQRLTFGCYRFIVDDRCVTENLFYGDDLPAKDRLILRRYVETPCTITPDESVHDLSLLTREQFADKIFKNAYKGRCLFVAFNFPFDISRIARDFTYAKRRFAGGFSLDFWSYPEGDSEVKDDYRPSICIKHIDSKRALKGFTGRKHADEPDKIPEDSTTGQPDKKCVFRGHFLDLRTLAFALTDRSYTLEKACEDYGVEHGKQPPRKHGIVTPKYIKYNRRDVLATSELAVKLLEEYDKHDISLQETKAYSPASIGKQTMGLLQRRHVLIDQIIPIGKESNSLEEVDAGLIHSAENVYTVYTDPQRDEWPTKILPRLNLIPVPLLVKMSGLSATTIKDTLATRSRPYRKNRERLAAILPEQDADVRT